MADVGEGTRLSVVTLGGFSVSCQGQVLSEDTRRSQKVWTLFEYLCVNRGRMVPAEEFYSVLWGDEDCQNPAKALQNLVYRLRGLLAPAGAGQLVRFAQGSYYWSAEAGVALDAERFERLIEEAGGLERTGEAYQAVDRMKEAAALYRGDFLPQVQAVWALAPRKRYRQAFLGLVVHLASLLRALNRAQEALPLCERALEMEPYEEPVHAAYIEAMMDLGQVKQARAHYERITAALYREFGVRPSQELKNTYRRVNEGLDHVSMDLDVLQQLLSEKGEPAGAFACPVDTFRALYMLEARRAERTGQVAFIVIMTLLSPQYVKPDPHVLAPAMEALGQVLATTLRRGDVITQWNDAQYVLMLPSLTFEDGEMVLKRLEARFQAQSPGPGLLLKSKLQPINVRA